MPNIKALYKRAHFILNTPDYIILKLAEEENAKVFRGLDSYLTPAAGQRLIDFKERDVMPLPEDLRRDRGWEQRWIKTLIARADGVAEPPRRWRRLDPAAGVAPAPAPVGVVAIAVPADSGDEDDQDDEDMYA